jgi:phage terminase large subunit-like protein
VTNESSFIEMGWWDECTQKDLKPAYADRNLPIWIGLDASVKRDSTAIVAVTRPDDMSEVTLVCHRIFQPSPTAPLDFVYVEETVRDLCTRFSVQEVRYDPYQMQATAQRLMRDGVPMVEFPQSVPNLTEASTNLFELIKSRSLAVYPDADMRLAVSRAVAVETTRGWRITKQSASHKIDCIVALAMACHGAKQKPSTFSNWSRYYDNELARAQAMSTTQQPNFGWEFGGAPSAPPAPIGEQVAAMNPTDRQLLDIFRAAPRRNFY